MFQNIYLKALPRLHNYIQRIYDANNVLEYVYQYLFYQFEFFQNQCDHEMLGLFQHGKVEKLFCRSVLRELADRFSQNQKRFVPTVYTLSVRTDI